MPSPRNPFEGFEELFERMNRQFESALRPLEGGLERRGRFDVSLGESSTGVDLADQDDAFVVAVDVPGYERDDIDVRLAGDRLSISGEREQRLDEQEDEYIRRERRADSFDRRIRLPEPIQGDQAEASINNGVLTITLPKREPEDGQTIEIE